MSYYTFTLLTKKTKGEMAKKTSSRHRSKVVTFTPIIVNDVNL